MALPNKAKTTAPAVKPVNIFSRDAFVRGGGLPEGNYVCFFDYRIHTAEDKTTGKAKGDPKLGIMLTAHPLDDLGADPKTQFYSLGSNAHKSFMPHPETGKTILPIPGAPAGVLYLDTGAQVFIQELRNCDPDIEGLTDGDLSQLDGVWIHVHPVPAPESWKALGKKSAATSEVGATAADDRPMTIAVPSEILEGGKPWEGGGGLEAAKKKFGGKGAKAPATGKTQAPATKPAAKEEEGVTEEDAMTVAREALAAVLGDGGGKTKIRIDAINKATEMYDETISAAVTETVFDNVDVFSSVLGELGFKIAGIKIVRA